VQPQVDLADTIYTGGDTVTMNDLQPSAEALAVEGGRIVAVGACDDVEKAHKGRSTKLVHLDGKTLLPGFLDAHSHYINSLTVANQVNLYAPPAGPGKDVASIVAELVKYRDANRIPKGENRISRAGAVIGADQRVTPTEALKAQTLHVAQQFGEQASKGSLEPGKLADMVVLDGNPLKVEPMAIKDIKVIETLKEGKTIYKAPAAR
jgi:predicted amidohydrolase YtcJ